MPGLVATSYAAGGTALRFYGVGAAEPDRVQIPLGPLADGQISASYPVNVAGDFTVEFWMKATAAENAAPACGNGWYYGNIIIDRDVDGAGDHGDYGVALCDGRIAFGVSAGDDDRQLVGEVPVTDGQWHHIAVTRADGGLIAIFVDGQPAGSAEGPAGRVDYRVNRETSQPRSDPYLVLGAEKHGYPGSYQYAGLLDDMRISSVVRYSAAFTRPDAPHPADGATVALYHFDEGEGATVGDSSGAAGGPSDGELLVGGEPASPAWSDDTPFAGAAIAPSTAAPTAETSAVAPTPEALATVAATAPAPPSEALPTAAATSAAPSVEVTATSAAPPADVTATRPPVITSLPAPERSAATAFVVSPTATVAGSPIVTASPSLQEGSADPPGSAGAAAAGGATASPPPTSNLNTLVLAWLAAGVALAAAVAGALRWRARG